MMILITLKEDVSLVSKCNSESDNQEIQRRLKALILKGARQVGKTWLMKEFGQSMEGIDNSAILLKADYQFKEPLTENYCLQQLQGQFEINPLSKSIANLADINLVTSTFSHCHPLVPSLYRQQILYHSLCRRENLCFQLLFLLTSSYLYILPPNLQLYHNDFPYLLIFSDRYSASPYTLVPGVSGVFREEQHFFFTSDDLQINIFIIICNFFPCHHFMTCFVIP